MNIHKLYIQRPRSFKRLAINDVFARFFGQRPTTNNQRRFFSLQIHRDQFIPLPPSPPARSIHHLLFFLLTNLTLRFFSSGRKGFKARHVLTNNFFRELNITFRAARFRIVKQYRLSMARSFSQTNISRDRSREQFFAEEPLQFSRDLLRQIGSVIKHCQDNPFNLERWIQRAANPLDRVQQFGDPFERKIFGLNPE